MGYRSSTWSLSDALAPDDALKSLAKRPMRAENAAAVRAARKVLDPNATRKTGDELVAAGLRHLGVRGESASAILTRLDVFVDRHHTTYVSMRRRQSLLGLSRYYILTHFDDGTCIETVARAKPVYPSTDKVTVRAGHGNDPLRDVNEHLEAVRERVAKGVRILPVRDLSGVDALARFHLSHVISPEIASDVANTKTTERKLASGLIVSVAMVVFLVLAALRP